LECKAQTNFEKSQNKNFSLKTKNKRYVEIAKKTLKNQNAQKTIEIKNKRN